MKTTDPRDPLDQKIDALFASRPIKPDSDFTTRVLNAAEAIPPQATKRPSVMAPVIRFALPIAAAIALALTVVQLNKPGTPNTPAANLTAAEAQEIFLLEETLSGLNSLSDQSLGGSNLLSTLEALTYDIES